MHDTGPVFEVEQVVAPDHPCLAGHFPGDPIVPAVVLLEHVACALERWRPGGRIAAVPRAKFLRPLRPGVPFHIRLIGGETRARFQCLAGGRLIAEGVVETISAAAHPDA